MKLKIIIALVCSLFTSAVYGQNSENQNVSTKFPIGIISLLILVALACIVLIIRAKNKAKRQKANSLLDIIKFRAAAMNLKLQDAKEIHITYPVWAKNQSNQYIEEAERLMREIGKKIVAIQGFIEEKEYGIEMLSIAEDAYMQYLYAQTAYQKSLDDIENQLLDFRECSPKSKKALEDMLRAVKESIDILLQEGWKIFDDKVEQFKEIQNKYDAIMQLTDDKEICEACTSLKKQVMALQSEIQEEFELIENNNKRLEAAKLAYNNIIDHTKAANNSLIYLKIVSPKNIWAPLESRIETLSVTMKHLPGHMEIVKENNTKEKQEVYYAAALLDSIEKDLIYNTGLVSVILDQEALWQSSTEKLSGMKEEAATSLRALMHAIKHSEVQDTTIKQAKELEEQYNNFMAHKNSPALQRQLSGLIKSITEIKKIAQNDIVFGVRTAELRIAKSQLRFGLKLEAARLKNETYNGDMNIDESSWFTKNTN